MPNVHKASVNLVIVTAGSIKAGGAQHVTERPHVASI